MEIYYTQQNSYLSSTFRRELTGAGKAAGASSEEEKEGGNLTAQTADQVEISEQARTLQQILAGKEGQEAKNGENEQEALAKRQSRLMDALEGKETAVSDGRLAYGDAAGKAAQNGENSESDDLSARIRDLQKQLRSATKRLNEAYKELSTAQAKAVKDNAKAMRRGENPDMPQNATHDHVKKEVKAAQQKIVSTQAEINSIQEQLQKLLAEQAQAAADNYSSAPTVSVGRN